MKEHPSFNSPSNIQSKIWRYLDFTKYVSLLSTSSLFFVRADKFEDEFEGAATKKEKEFREDLKNKLNMPDYAFDMVNLTNRMIRKTVGVSSWHLSDYESTAMWKLYLKSNEGVAIQTTFKKLSEAFENHKTDNIYTGVVKYTDYEIEEIEAGNVYNRFMNKRNSFDFEKEVRSMFCRYPEGTPGEVSVLNKYNISDHYETIKGSGIYIPTDINELVENVIISPYADEWFYKLVSDITNSLGYNFKISRSQISETPFY